MKRFSKILAVLLTVCVIAGLIAVFASADTAYTEYTNDASSGFGSSSYASSSRDGWTTNASGEQLSSTSNFYNTTPVVSVGEDENKYFRIYATTYKNGDPTTAVSGTGRHGWAIVPAGTASSVDSYDYVVLEYLFMSEGLKYPSASVRIKSDYSKSPQVAYSSFSITTNASGDYCAQVTGKEVVLSKIDGDWNTATLVIDVSGKTAYTYINGEYLTEVDLSGYDALQQAVAWELQGLKLNNAGDNICVDGISYRCYGDGTGAYTTESAGLTQLVAAPTTTSVYECTDVAYNYGATQATFPKTNVYDAEGAASVHSQTIVAEVDGTSYIFVDSAIDALLASENKVINLYVGADLSDVKVDSFTVNAYNGVDVTLPEGYTVTTDDTVEGVVTYVATKTIVAYVGETPYYDISEAFAALAEGGTIKIYADVTITDVTLDSFTVEVYNNANVTFASDIIKTHSATPANRNGVMVYSLTKNIGYTDYRENFDGTFASGETVSVTSNGKVVNNYLKLTSSATLNLLSGVDVDTFDKNAYAVTQYLLSAEDGNYMTGTLKLTDASGSNVCTLTISKDGDTYYATVTGGDKTYDPIPLRSNGDWNVITTVQTKYSSVSAGAAQGQRAFVYVNGVCGGNKQQSGSAARGALTKLTVTKSGDGNLIIDGFNARFYCSGLTDANVPTYTAPEGVYGLSGRDFPGSHKVYNTSDFGDIFYNKYGTTLDYPATLVNGEVHTQTAGVVAEVNGIGYFDLATAINALTENGTIKLYVDADLSGVELDKFYVEAPAGITPTFGSAHVYTTETQDDTVIYTVTKVVPAYIGETPYDDVDTALGALEKDQTIKFYVDATITGDLPESFKVEVYNNANVVFDPIFVRNHKIVKSVGEGVTVYDVTETDYVELIDNLDSIKVTTANGWTATTLTAGDNNYQKFTTTGTQKTTLDLFSGETSIPAMASYNYAAVQFLLGAENGAYIDGLYIHPASPTGNPSNIRGLKIVKSGDTYEIGYSEESGTPSRKTALKTNGDWNVVTIVLQPGYNSGKGVRFYYYVNGAYVGGSNQSSVTTNDYITRLQLSTATAPAATDNVIIDGYSMRYYSATTFSSVVNSPSTVDITGFQDLRYNKNNTTADYPVTLVNGDIHYQSAQAEVTNPDEATIGFMNADNALAALKEGGTVKYNVDATVTGTVPENFTVEYATDVNVTIADDIRNRYDIEEGANSYELALAGEYNIEFKFGDSVVTTGTMKTSLAPNPSAVDWSAYIFGDASDITWEFSVNGGESFETLAGSWAKVEQGITVIVRPADSSVVEVQWYNKEGTAVEATDYYFPNTDLAVKHNPSSDLAVDLDNKWYDIGYTWVEVPTEVGTEDVQIYQKTTIVNALQWRFNYSLGLRFYPTFYIPVPEEGDGVTVEKNAYAGDIDLDKGGKYYQDVNGKLTDIFEIDEWKNGTDLSQYKWTVTGEQFTEKVGATADSGIAGFNLRGLGTSADGKYYTYSTDYQPNNLANIRALQVCYTVEYDLDGDGEAESYRLTAPLMVTLASTAPDYVQVADYSEIVLNTTCDKGSKLVVEFLRLYQQTGKADSTLNAAIDTLIAAHKEKWGDDCTCCDSTLDDAIPDASDETLEFTDNNTEDALAQGNILIGFRTDGNAAGFEIYIPTEFINSMTNPEGALEEGVEKTYKFVVASKSNGIYHPNDYYEFNETAVSGEYTKYRPKNSNASFKLYDFYCNTSFKIYLVTTTKTTVMEEGADEPTVTTTTEETVYAEFTYSLAEYLYQVNATNPIAAETTNFQLLKAYKNFVDAAYDYKDLSDGDK